MDLKSCPVVVARFECVAVVVGNIIVLKFCGRPPAQPHSIAYLDALVCINYPTRRVVFVGCVVLGFICEQTAHKLDTAPSGVGNFNKNFRCVRMVWSFFVVRPLFYFFPKHTQNLKQ